MGRGAPGALDNVIVRWGGGGDVQAGESVLSFKSYEKGREKWQGETLHGVWFDEEPLLDIYFRRADPHQCDGWHYDSDVHATLGHVGRSAEVLERGEVEKIGKH